MASEPTPLGLTPERHQECVRQAALERTTFDQVALAKGYVTEAALLKYFSETLGVPLRESLKGVRVPEAFMKAVPIRFAREFAVVGIEEGPEGMFVATAAPLSADPLDGVARVLGRAVTPLLAPKDAILGLIDASYEHRSEQVGEVIGEIDEQTVLDAAAVADGRDLLDVAHKAPVVKLVDMLLFQARKRRASDLHFQPYNDRLQVRYRIDGILHNVLELPKGIQDAVVSRVKVMAGMDIAEKRLPQDGRATVRVGPHEIDLRVSSLPTSWGERIVLRLLDKGQQLFKLDQLGLDEKQFKAYERLVQSTHGIILVTGPTGSGKTTTLYATLDRLNVTASNVLTLEDPIEYQLEGISQTQVNYAKGLTFDTGLRTILRQDPDIIMVGEIRDLETARMAIQSALTGHLVFSTLHTNDAVSAAARLLDLGIEPYLVSSSLLAVMAQRLIRTLCPHCKEPFIPEEESLKELDLERSALPDGKLWRGKGCDECMRTGYHGRAGIYELLVIDEPLRQTIMQRKGATEIKLLAMARGLKTLRASAAGRVLEGSTTPEEALRVTQMDVF